MGKELSGALWEGRTRPGERDGKVTARGLENDLKTWTKIKGENHSVVTYKYCDYFIICFAFHLLLCADRCCLTPLEHSVLFGPAGTPPVLSTGFCCMISQMKKGKERPWRRLNYGTLRQELLMLESDNRKEAQTGTEMG